MKGFERAEIKAEGSEIRNRGFVAPKPGIDDIKWRLNSAKRDILAAREIGTGFTYDEGADRKLVAAIAFLDGCALKLGIHLSGEDEGW